MTKRSLTRSEPAARLQNPQSVDRVGCFCSLFNRMGRLQWNVRQQKIYSQGVSVAGYLARYMSGGPISDKRIISVSDTEVVCKYVDHRDGVEKRMKLTPHEFLSRWFEHVPPRDKCRCLDKCRDNAGASNAGTQVRCRCPGDAGAQVMQVPR